MLTGFSRSQLWIQILQFLMDGIHDFLRHIRHRSPLPLCLGEKASDVKTDYMVLVQMRQIPLRPCYLLVVKKHSFV